MTILIGHILTKFYAIVLDTFIFEQLERGKFRARGQAGYCRDYHTIDGHPHS
jgi:hypothetical protein